MPKPYRSAEHTRAYRQRLRAAGSEEVLFQLPRETVAMLDATQATPGAAQPQPGVVATDRAEGGSRPANHLKMQKPALPGGL